MRILLISFPPSPILLLPIRRLSLVRPYVQRKRSRERVTYENLQQPREADPALLRRILRGLSSAPTESVPRRSPRSSA